MCVYVCVVCMRMCVHVASVLYAKVCMCALEFVFCVCVCMYVCVCDYMLHWKSFYALIVEWAGLEPTPSRLRNGGSDY